jgi:hypothetical protein
VQKFMCDCCRKEISGIPQYVHRPFLTVFPEAAAKLRLMADVTQASLPLAPGMDHFCAPCRDKIAANIQKVGEALAETGRQAVRRCVLGETPALPAPPKRRVRKRK